MTESHTVTYRSGVGLTYILVHLWYILYHMLRDLRDFFNIRYSNSTNLSDNDFLMQFYALHYGIYFYTNACILTMLQEEV